MEDLNRGAPNMAFQGYHSSRSRAGKSTERHTTRQPIECRPEALSDSAQQSELPERRNEMPPVFSRGTFHRERLLGTIGDLLLSFNFLDDDRGGSSTRKCFPTGGNFLAGEWKQLVVLAAGRSSVSDGPVDRAVVRQNDQWRPCLGACHSAFGADWFVQALGECACRIQNIAIYSSRFSGVAAPGQRAGDYCQDQGQHQSFASVHVMILRKHRSTLRGWRIARQ